MSRGSVAVLGPTGAKTWIELSNIWNVQQLRQKAENELPVIPGQSVGKVRLTFDGKTLEDLTPLSECKFLPSSVIHLVLQVHGG